MKQDLAILNKKPSYKNSHFFKYLVIIITGFLINTSLFSQPINDDCSSVTPTTLVSGVPQIFNGTTLGATMSVDESSVFGLAVVWEAVTLTGTCNNLTVSYCGTDPGVMDNVFLDIYADCPLTTFTGSDIFDDCGDGNPTYTFFSLPAGTYYLPVVADSSGNSAFGPYIMTVTSIDCPLTPVNDDCIGAIPVNCGDVVNGSTDVTSGATDDPTAPDCTGGSGFGPGVWYSFTGTGTPWTISLCGSDYDTYLSLYSGPDCASLTCEDSNDDNFAACGPGNNSQIDDVPTIAGTTYYILINGFDGEVGNYTLTLSSPPPANDDCTTAIAVSSGTISGNTSCSGIDVVPVCGTASIPTAGGIWYSYTSGCSGNITASLCSGTSFNTQLSIFDGTCGALNCIGGNDDFCASQSEVTWPGVSGTTYYILVHGSGTEVGSFDLTLSQVDALAPVADVVSLPPVSGSCSVSVTVPTATDNCAGTIDGTTPDPTTYTTAGSYVVNWTYDDGNGNTSTQTQNVTVTPDLIPPAIVCTNDTSVGSDFDVCGALVNYTLPVATDNCMTPYSGTDNYYIRSNNAGEPWGGSDNIDAMDAVFGGGWNSDFFESCVPANVFSSATKFVFLEGSDGNADELNAFLSTNLPLIEAYVYNGGTIFINAAPNEGGNIDFGFNGTTLNYDGGNATLCGSGDAVNPTDPIFNGPFLPCGTSFTGNSFSHAYITGTGLTNIIEGCGFFQYSSMTWGGGFATFGGMTMPQFHDPFPESQNLRQNIISWVANQATFDGSTVPTVNQTTGLPSGSVFPVGTTTNTFVATDASGNTATCSFDIVVDDLTPPATSGGALVLTISYGGFWLDETTWEVYDANNTLIASGGPYGNAAPGTIAEQIDISGAIEPLTFNGETMGFANDNVLNYEFTCGATTISSGNIFGGSTGSFSNIQGCAITLPDMNDACSVTITGPAPTLNDNCDGSITGTTTDPLTYSTNGTYIVTWTFADASGNTSTLTQTVNITDSLAPVPNVVTLSTASANCTVTLSSPTATDNCAGTVTATTTDPTTYNAAGTYTVTWTYDDGRGNTSTQTQTVVVTDNTSPVPDQPLLANIIGNCVVTIDDLPTATDNCAGTITATTNDPLSYNLIGTFLIIWHFDDGNGNTWTQNQIVVVNPCVGLEEESGQWNALIYPNPSSGIFTLSLSEMPTENTQVRLVDALGQVLYSEVLQGQIQQFDFSHLASATYYLLVTSDHGQISKPIIIRQNY